MISTQLIENLLWRYAVKVFDPQRKIEAATWKAIEQSMVLAPSSFGLQPWKFFVITSAELKEKLPSFSWNQSQPKDCSHMVVLATRKTIDEAYIDHYLDQIALVRESSVEGLKGYRKAMLGSIKKMDTAAMLVWNTRQVYIALGQLLASAAVLGVDACPMEGIDVKAYDSLLGIVDTEYTTLVGCAMGYRDASDKYAHAKKVRFPTEQVVQYL